MAVTKTYDPKKFLLNFAGIIISGYADGTFVTVEFDEDAFTKKIGAGGEVVRELNQNLGGKVTIVLMQHSLCNDQLTTIAQADRLTGSGVGVISGKELNGTSGFIGEAWIQKIPNLERGKESSQNTWVFDVASLDMFNGGLLT